MRLLALRDGGSANSATAEAIKAIPPHSHARFLISVTIGYSSS
jgi:hypothetical protein